jgi:hypothetical protein
MTKSQKTYSEMLKGELLAMAQRLGLTNLSRLRKDEIIDLVKRAARRRAAKKAATKKAATKKTATKKTATKKAATKKTSTKKAATKKAAPKTATPKKTATKKTATKKTATKKTATRKVVTRKTSVKKPTAKKTTKKAATKTTKTAKKATTRKVRTAKASTKKSTTRSTDRSRRYRAGAKGKAEYHPEELQGIDERLPVLPDSYGENRIVLLPRDPGWLFAYWNLTAEYKEAARAAGGATLAIRLFDVTDVDFDGTNAQITYEHECAEWARSWYLPTPSPSREYVVEIGYRSGVEWFPLARSKRVSIPSERPSAEDSEEFLTIGFDEELDKIQSRLPSPPEHGAAELHASGATGQTLLDDGEMRIVVGGARLSPSGAPTWPPFSQVVVGSGVPGSLGQIAGSLGQVPGSLGVVGSVSHLPGSLGQIPGSLGQLSARPDQAAGAGPGPDGIAATAYTEYTEAPVVLEESNRPLLQASVEMVISGRSFPDTDLTIAGHAVPVGPDGAFSLRVSVPEGLREVPIIARSRSTNQARALNLRFGRRSE